MDLRDVYNLQSHRRKVRKYLLLFVLELAEATGYSLR